MTLSLATVDQVVAAADTEDPLARIEAQRASARADLEAAEQEMMVRAPTDRDGFVEARARRDEAQLTLDQLVWAEKAEHQRQEQAERAAKMAKLGGVQREAQAAHERGAVLADQARRTLDELCDALRGLQECQAAIDKAAHFEQFAVRDGEIPRSTVRPRLSIRSDDPVVALRAAKAYLRLAQVAEQVGEQRAAQGKL